MTILDNVFEKAIKEHCKVRDDLFSYKGLKVISSAFIEKRDCFDNETLVKYRVVCSFKAKKYENNRAIFQVNVYDNPTGSKENAIIVFFDGEEYEA